MQLCSIEIHQVFTKKKVGYFSNKVVCNKTPTMTQDFNAKVGKEYFVQPACGNEETNDNG
jgi:hypothetical protein